MLLRLLGGRLAWVWAIFGWSLIAFSDKPHHPPNNYANARQRKKPRRIVHSPDCLYRMSNIPRSSEGRPPTRNDLPSEAGLCSVVSKNSVVMRCSQPTVKDESALHACIMRLERETGFEPATACLEAIRT